MPLGDSSVAARRHGDLRIGWGRLEVTPGRAAARGAMPFLDELHVGSHPRAVGAGAGLAAASPHSCSGSWSVAPNQRPLLRRSRRRGQHRRAASIDGRADERPQQEAPGAPSRNCTRFSYTVGSSRSAPTVPSPCFSRSVTGAQVGPSPPGSRGGVSERAQPPSVPPSRVSWPSRPCPWATRSETSRKLCATIRRSSATVLYCGSWSRPRADCRATRALRGPADRVHRGDSARTDLPLSGESSTPTRVALLGPRQERLGAGQIALSLVNASGSS